MKKFKTFKTTRRTLGIVAAILILVGGVTFAFLQSQPNVLTGNTIETAVASLGTGTDGVTFGNSHSGFGFSGLIPGGPAQPATGNTIYLKNFGTTPLSLKLFVSSVPTNPDNVDLSKVYVLLTPQGSSSSSQSFSLQSLLTGAANGGVSISGSSLANNSVQQYILQISMDSDAVHSTVAAIGNIDLAFNGVAQAD